MQGGPLPDKGDARGERVVLGLADGLTTKGADDVKVVVDLGVPED